MSEVWRRVRRARVALLAGAIGLVLAAAFVVVAVGPGGSAQAPRRAVPLPVFMPPAVQGGPSVANFCTVLTADVGHLSELGHASGPAQIVQVLGQYVDTAPAIWQEAPPQIAAPARLYVEETTTIYGAMASSNLRKGVVNAQLLRQFDTPAAQTAAQQVRAYAEENCGFDPENPTTASTASRSDPAPARPSG
jgi:hypothetical protein